MEAWIDRADRAALALHEGREFAQLSRRERLLRLIMAWLDAPAPHHRLTREMLACKPGSGHLHLPRQDALRTLRNRRPCQG